MKINSDSPYRDKLSSAILHLQEEGAIQAMYDKWWKQKNIDKFCDNTKTPSTKALELRNVGGVFVLVLTGTFCGFVIALFEFVCNARKISRKGEVRLCINLTRKSKILNFLNVFFGKIFVAISLRWNKAIPDPCQWYMYISLVKNSTWYFFQSTLWFEIKQQLYFALRCCKYRKVPVTVASMADIATEETRTTLLLEPTNEKGAALGDNGEDTCLVDHVHGKDMSVHRAEKQNTSQSIGKNGEISNVENSSEV